MEDGSAVLKGFLFLTFSVHLASADTHSLKVLFTGVTPGINFPEFTGVGLVDGQQCAYYDSNIRELTEKTNWMQKIKADNKDGWEEVISHVQKQPSRFQTDIAAIMKIFNQTEGVHTLQRMYGCELYYDNTTRGYNQYGYDGEDFFSLDLKTGTWTAAKPQAENLIKQWELAGNQAEAWRLIITTDCIEWLKRFLSHGKETLERKVRPKASVFQKHSSSPEVVCHTTGFFPKAVMITWQKDGEDVHEGVELRETLPNQDGSFQKRSILKVPAEELQKHTYTCVIQHSSLEKEIVLEVPKGGALIAVVICVVAALVVLVAVVVGIVVWKKKKEELCLQTSFSLFQSKPVSDPLKC